MILHILGSDIPHHNRTQLAFFQESLLAVLEYQPLFYVVSSLNLAAEFPALSIRCFATKAQLAKAVMAVAKSEPQAKFVLHGQFNFPLWLAICCGKVPAWRCAWHIWGADLYENSTAWRFKLAYPLRRFAQRRLAQIWATCGDLAFAQKHLGRQNAADRLLYFPTKLPTALPKRAERKNRPFTVLLGNSGDHSNRHLQGLADIYRQFGSQVKVIIPMGYPLHNQAYIEQVYAHSKRWFTAENVQILSQTLAFEEYLTLLAECDLGLFLFERQQGIGTICALLAMNIPVALSPKNPFCCDLEAENVPFLLSDALDPQKVRNVAQALAEMDKSTLRFFPPNYVPLWQQCLTSWYHSN